MAKKKVTRKLPTKETNFVMIQMLNDMNAKLQHIHKDVNKNKQDISKLQQDMAFGKGGVKALIIIAGIVSTLVGAISFIGGK